MVVRQWTRSSGPLLAGNGHSNADPLRRRLTASATATLAANPGQPNFSPALYGDGEVWGTKGAAAIPAPREHNRHSFDVLYVITNSNNPQGQLPVAEAAPGYEMRAGPCRSGLLVTWWWPARRLSRERHRVG